MKKIAFLFCLLVLQLWVVLPGFSQNQQNTAEKLFSFGVIADVQYADIDQVGKRNYRGSLEKLQNTINLLNQYDLEFVASLGDLIDRQYESFEKPLQLLSPSKAPIHHVLGNHEFLVEDKLKKTVPALLNNPKGYYSFESHGFVMILLNGMEESMDAYPKASKNYQKGEAVYQKLKVEGANNAQTWNGGLGKKQMKWLGKEIKKAEKEEKKAVLFSHFPLLPENGLQLWGNRAVLELINNSESVVAHFSGHHHSGNYVEDKGIHHLTFKGMVEALSEVSGGVVDVYPDKMVLTGFGVQDSLTLIFR
jgi:manganese-dependent ADP-ribose/CDP-alcohol diphosphatase